jgi:hypothetical protein
MSRAIVRPGYEDPGTARVIDQLLADGDHGVHHRMPTATQIGSAGSSSNGPRRLKPQAGEVAGYNNHDVGRSRAFS